MQKIPINTYNSPTVILELIYRLKVKQVMTTKLITAGRDTRLRDIQNTMRERSITGVPIAEGKRLLGIVSMDDINQGSRSRLHRRNGRLLYDDKTDRARRGYARSHSRSAISTAIPITAFRCSANIKSSWGWSPVVISPLLCCLRSTKRSTRSNGSQAQKSPAGKDRHLIRTFSVFKHDFENAGFASTEIKKYLKEIGTDAKTIRRAAIASYELEINLVVHADGGDIKAEVTDDHITITARDKGPGIDDVDKAMEEGFSTANEWIRSLGFGAGYGTAQCQTGFQTSSPSRLNSIKEQTSFPPYISTITQKKMR